MKVELAAMIRKEFRQIIRDPRTLGILLVVPLLLLVLFGFAISLDVETVGIAVVDGDGSPESRRVLEMFGSGDVFERAEVSFSASGAEEALVDGTVDAVVVLPPGFGRDLTAGETPEVQILIDGSNVTVASTAQGYIEAALSKLAVRRIFERRIPLPGSVDPDSIQSTIDVRSRTWYNPELRSTVFLVPGLVSFIMVITAVISTAMSVVREKERGTMEMLEASPLRPLSLILGKTVPYMVLALGETMLILAAGRFFFGVEIKGSYVLLLCVTTLFLLSCLGLGLLLSTLADTQQTAFLLSVIVTVLPTFILSGFVFPIRNMPPVVQGITYIFPARYFLEAERALILRGAGLRSIWPQALALAVFSAVMLGVSGLRLAGGGRGKTRRNRRLR